MKESNGKPVGLLNEDPSPESRHIVNYLQCIGDFCRRYRNLQDENTRSRENFAKIVLQPYLGTVPARTTLERCEQGSAATNWGIVASYIYEMGAFPDLIKVLSQGQAPTLRIMQLIQKQQKEALSESKQRATSSLNASDEKERLVRALRK